MPPAPHFATTSRWVRHSFMLQEGKLRHEGGLEVVGPAFQMLQLQGPTSELIPPCVRTAELAMRKIDLRKSRTCSCPISVYWKFQTLSSPRELFNCKSKQLVVFSTSIPYIWWAACFQSKDCQLGLQQCAEDVTYEPDLLLLCFGFVLTQRHTGALTTTKQNNSNKPSRETETDELKENSTGSPFSSAERKREWRWEAGSKHAWVLERLQSREGSMAGLVGGLICFLCPFSRFPNLCIDSRRAHPTALGFLF